MQPLSFLAVGPDVRLMPASPRRSREQFVSKGRLQMATCYEGVARVLLVSGRSDDGPVRPTVPRASLTIIQYSLCSLGHRTSCNARIAVSIREHYEISSALMLMAERVLFASDIGGDYLDAWSICCPWLIQD